MYPHQPAQSRRTQYPELGEEDALRLIFVGGDFFRKGGEAILRAVEALGDELNLQLTVISKVEGNDYTGTPPPEVDVASIRRRLEGNPRIDWRRSVSHDEVMSAIEMHHVGLLPTFSDTFGYSVLEFMSLGVPAIVSDLQALPEFADSVTGWQVHVEKDDHGEWVGRHPNMDRRSHHYFESVADTTSQIEGILSEIRTNPALLSIKAASTHDRIAQQFDPSTRAATVRSIYEQALTS
ncbi:MAG: glycosyltransferase [Acidimicrobiia bacterium]|nr:glycosyltransferase [Acidimicrobiia bacterium]